MTTPPMDPNLSGTTPVVKPVKAGPPRALLLGGVVGGLALAAAAGFYFMNQQGDGAVDEEASVPPPAVTRPAAPQTPTVRAKPAVDPAVAAAKAQAAAALGAGGPGQINLTTSFDNVPVILGGTGKRLYPTVTAPAPDNGGKVKPIVQGRLPSALRSDPFVSRLIIPLTREFAYTLAVPIRLAPPPKPPVDPRPVLDPEIRLGPLPYVPRRVAGFLEFGGVSAIVETGAFGNGDISIVQPGATVPSGIAGIPPLTVESISSTEMVLRAEDGRSTRVALSGIPGGVIAAPGGNPGGPGFPGGPGGPGGPGFPSRGGGRGRGVGGGGAMGVD